MKISRGKKGTVLHCFAGCRTEDILAAVGMTESDLYDEPARSQSWESYVEKSMSKKLGKPIRIEARYDLKSLDGEYSYTKLRMTGKEMRYGLVQAGRWSWGLPKDEHGMKLSRRDMKAVFTKSVTGFRKAAADGSRVFYAEGEKDVITLERNGFTALTAGSCDDWQADFAELFRGGEVILCGDYDSPGVELLRQIRKDLQGVAKSVTVIFPCVDELGQDVSDFFDRRGGTVEELEAMIAEEQREGRYATDEALRALSKRLKELKDSSRRDTPTAGSGEQLPAAGDDQQPDLMQFHHVAKSGKVTGVYDWAIFQHIKQREHIVVIGQIPYVYLGGRYVMDKTGAQIKTWISELILPEFIKSTTIKRIYDLFLSRAEFIVKSEEMNQYPESWVCFRNGMYDPVAGKLLPHDPAYRAMNQIPHDFNPDARPGGEHIESWLQYVIPDADDREMVLEYCGYCMTRDVRQQVFLMLWGLGGSGKSTLLKLIRDVIGADNISSKGLTQLTQRFAAFALMGKLVNICADIKTGAIEDVSILKQVLGEDTIDGEAKGKDSISFISYAKLLFSVNDLPTILNERTNGFYRRLIVCPMNAQPTPDNIRPDLFGDFTDEIDYFIHLAVSALKRMYQRGRILISDSSKKAVVQVRLDSDSVEAWMDERAYRVSGAMSVNTKLYDSYAAYCEEEKIKGLNRKGFYKALRSKGFTEKRQSTARYFVGLTTDSSLATSVTEEQSASDTFKEVDVEELPFS